MVPALDDYLHAKIEYIDCLFPVILLIKESSNLIGRAGP